MILSTGDRLRLDLAMHGKVAEIEASAMVDEGPPALLTDAELRAKEKANMIAVLRHAGWRVSGPGGAAELLGLKPSTLAYRMRVFGIRHTPV